MAIVTATVVVLVIVLVKIQGVIRLVPSDESEKQTDSIEENTDSLIREPLVGVDAFELKVLLRMDAFGTEFELMALLWMVEVEVNGKEFDHDYDRGWSWSWSWSWG